LAGDSAATLHDAHLLDVSAGGVGLRAARPFVPGEEFFLLLFDAAELAATPLRYSVARCEALGDGQFHVGASFVGNRESVPVITFVPRP
jgi:hypothetical protein